MHQSLDKTAANEMQDTVIVRAMCSLFSGVGLFTLLPLWDVTDDQLLPCPCFFFMLQVFGFSLKQYLFPYLCLSGGGWVSSPAHGEALEAAFGSAQGWVGSKGALPALSRRQLPKFHILTGGNCCWMCPLL